MASARQSAATAACGLFMLAQTLWSPPAIADVPMPRTVAAEQLSGFVAALNSGDRTVLHRFLAAHADLPDDGGAALARMTDEDYKLYALSKGVTVEKVEESSPTAITVLAKARATGLWSRIYLFAAAAPPNYRMPVTPGRIAGLGISDAVAPPEDLPSAALTDRELRRRIKGLIAKLSAEDDFSGTIYVARHGRLVYAEARGLADRAWRVPNRIDTRYNLASVTKMFTAVAVAQLVEQGKLFYDSRVGDVLPDYANKAVRSVTVAQLLSHTSGLIGGRALVEKTPEPQSARTLAPWLATFADEPLTARPGQRFDYSNAGFILLGAIIEKVSGQTYYDYVHDHVFKPAGMTRTGFFELDHDLPDMARGYMDGPAGTRLDNIYTVTVKGAPHTGAYSTGQDMVRFSEALTHHVLLGQASLDRLWQGVTEDPVTHREYGFGASIDHYNGQTIVSHGGGWKGVTNQFDIYPGLGYTVVVLTNIDDDPTAIAYKLREWLTQGPVNVRPQAEAAPAFDVSATVDGAKAAGSPLTIGVRVTNHGGTAHAGIVDIEIVDAAGKKVDQQVTEGQKLAAGVAKVYQYTWSPTAPGAYTVRLGIFGAGWAPKYYYDEAASAIEVR